jgi:hypothetical protein
VGGGIYLSQGDEQLVGMNEQPTVRNEATATMCSAGLSQPKVRATASRDECTQAGCGGSRVGGCRPVEQSR